MIKSSNAGGSWEPSVLYLLGLVFVEIAAMATLRYFTKHGG
jgi:hypothetical protein